MAGEEKAVYPRRPLQKRTERSEGLRWPSPTPLPILPSEDVGRLLQRILERLDAIEKRLENIEKTLIRQQSTP